MALNIQFSRVCEKSFDQLQGADQMKRYCPDCRLEVINLDPLGEAQANAVLNLAAKANLQLCVTATVEVENPGTPCAVERAMPRPLMGTPPTPDMQVEMERAYEKKLAAQQQIQAILEANQTQTDKELRIEN